MECEEIMWKQWSWVEWLREGDKNTRYFHAKAPVWRRKNSTKRLQSDLGEWKEGKQVEALIIDYFKDLLSTSNIAGRLEFLSSLKGSVTKSMNRELSKEYSSDEVYHALMQMHPIKAPGPDGMLLVFFQRHWHIVGALHSGKFPSDFNHMFIFLIPKKFYPTKVLEYLPISLCNVLYKLISKVIANRLWVIMPSIISKI